MATDLNRVVLIGRLARDPELRQTQGGGSYCRFSLACNRSYTANGERREEVSFLNCVVWGKQAEILNTYAKKGKQVAVEGRLQQRSYETQDGKKQSAVDIVVESFQLLGSKGAEGASSYAPEMEPKYGGSSMPVMPDMDTIEDDDVPF